MSDNRTDLPSVNAPNFNQRLRETIQTYLGKQGSPLDRGLTLRDLIDAGVLKVKSGFTLKPGSVSGSIPVEPGPGVVDVYEPDLTPPPTPTGFTVTAAISNLIIEHDAPLYTQGHGHLRTLLYGKIVDAGGPLPTFADASEIAQFSGAVYAHPSNPATTWRFWIKWETIDNVLSIDPAGGTNGVEAITGQDVSKLVKAMTGPGNPFKVVTEQMTLPDGTVVPAGTYTADAFIHNGQITNAKIASLAVDSAKIASVSADKITAGSIAVGQHIQSAGYVAGSSGWRINGDGSAEFSNVTVRGTVYASSGQFSGTLLGGSATGYSSGIGFYAGAPSGGSYQFRVGNPSGNRLEWDGSNVNLISPQLTISNGSASFSGSLNAASGTFEGSLEGATGTFAGTLAAGVLDSAAFDSIKYPYPNSGTFNLEIPELKAGWTAMHMRLTILGAGGGGGGGAASGAPNRNPTSSGGGGGAGQKNVYVVTSGISPRTPLSIQVGYGGNPGVGDSTWDGNSVAATPGSNGGNSSVTIGGSVYSASGGAGGGAGAAALADSFVGSGVGTGGGSGGSLGGQSGTGGYAISAAGGAGGSSEFGTGGSGGAAAYQYAGAGANGGVGAGGGGGGADAFHPDRGYAAGGGYGGKGYVLVEFYDPNTVVLNSRYSALIKWLDGIGKGAVPSAAR